VNAADLGNATDLGSFLFGQERSSLDVYRPILMDLQHGRCFYCHGDLEKRAEVDHFIPWSRYPSDLGHNFVLAHATCNLKKSDYLACEYHLAVWTERNRVTGLDTGFSEAGILHDLQCHRPHFEPIWRIPPYRQKCLLGEEGPDAGLRGCI
jgi:5-methylcytosine-specific restriction endonuclease McrA